MIDFKRFCNDYSLPYSNKISHGFINVQCPFCDDKGMHLGINVEGAYASCFKCGGHPLNKVIAVLTGMPFKIAKDIVQRYSQASGEVRRQDSRENIPSRIILPTGTQELTQKARNYLIGRKFDPDKLIQDWRILSTGHIGFYKHRLFAPIYQSQQLVSYQCRDITGNAPQKYLACHQEDEIIQHQHCVYGLDQATEHGKTCLVVEGITDVWRMGHGAIATFGTGFTKQQARLIAMNFRRIFILFDSEPQAQEQAEKLGFLIGSSFSNIVEVINLPFLIDDIDPGDLPQDTANEIMREIGL